MPAMQAAASCGFSSSALAAAPSAASQPSLLAGRSLPGTATRPPKAPPPRKAATAAECERLEQLPNIGPALAADLRLVGIGHPQALASADALALYRALEKASGRRQDPCVLDTFMAACDFMRGGPARPWWSFTAERKRLHGVV